jgi:hypothetical protein
LLTYLPVALSAEQNLHRIEPQPSQGGFQGGIAIRRHG